MRAWMIAGLYLLIGVGVGRVAARAAYRWDRNEFPSLARNDPKEGLVAATAAFVITLAFWPVVGLLLATRYLVSNSIPEYRAELDKQLSAVLDEKIRTQQAEIKRLHREIEGWHR